MLLTKHYPQNVQPFSIPVLGDLSLTASHPSALRNESLQSVSLLHLQGCVIQSAFVLFLPSPNVHSQQILTVSNPVFSRPFPLSSPNVHSQQILTVSNPVFSRPFPLSSPNVHSQQIFTVSNPVFSCPFPLSSPNIHSQQILTAGNPVFSRPFPVFPKCSLSANTHCQ